MKMASLLTLLVCLLFPVMATASNVQFTTIAARSMAGQSATANKLKVASREQAVRLVKRQYQGKLLKVQSSRINGHPAYRVKLLSKRGVVFYVTVDAQTGRISRN